MQMQRRVSSLYRTQSRHDLGRRGEAVSEVIRDDWGVGRVGAGEGDRARVESVWEGRVLVDAHVTCTPGSEVRTVAGVVTPTEMDRDESREGAGVGVGGGGDVVDGAGGEERCGEVVCGARLEERKVACERGVYEWGPCKVGEDGGCSEGVKEGEDAWAAKEAAKDG